MENGGIPDVDVSATGPGTRWDRRSPEPDPPDRTERSGVYLAAFVALALPTLIIVTAVRAMADAASWTFPRQRVELELPSAEPEREVAGVSVTAPSDPERVPSTTSRPVGSGANPNQPSQRPAASSPPIIQPSAPESPTSTAPLRVVPSQAPSSDATTTSTSAPVSPTVVPPITSSTTTAGPSPTTSPAVATSVLSEDAPEFIQRVDIGELGSEFVRYRFATDSAAAYSAVLLRNGTVDRRTTGTARAGERVQASFEGLLPGTDYGIQVMLDGEPEAASAVVSFRTSGGAEPGATVPVELLDIRIVAVATTQVELHYASNICANGSFTIADSSGVIVGRNSGQTEGCTTRHLAIPGFWTPALQPGATYTVTLQVEADGQGIGAGNVATADVSVTAAG